LAKSILDKLSGKKLDYKMNLRYLWLIIYYNGTEVPSYTFFSYFLVDGLKLGNPHDLIKPEAGKKFNLSMTQE
jgi:hypothetical protein